jgi:membrane protein implicated in regulation of membrane protease activity
LEEFWTMNATADFGSTALSAFARAAGLMALAVGAALALVFAFAAALVVGLMILGAAIAMRFMPRRKRASGGPEVLEARRTPAGWVVETATQRKA